MRFKEKKDIIRVIINPEVIALEIFKSVWDKRNGENRLRNMISILRCGLIVSWRSPKYSPKLTVPLAKRR